MSGQDIRDNAGPPIPGVGLDLAVSVEQDLAAFDALGPMTREVINMGLCVRWSAFQTLRMIREVWRADPNNPRTDGRMARLLVTGNAEIMARIRRSDEADVAALDARMAAEGARMAAV